MKVPATFYRRVERIERALDDKQAETLRARCALVGVQLHRLEGGRLLITRWGLARELADVDEAARWLRSLGVEA